MNNIEKLPQMTFKESVTTVINKLTDFKGRARRSELWWYYLLCMIVSMAVSLLPLGLIVRSVVSLLIQLSLLSVTVRRLHDNGIGGWLVVLAIILGVAGNIYIYQSGLLSTLQSVNPSPEAIIKIVTQPVFIILGIASAMANIAIFIICIIDGKPCNNKYGASPKYVPADEER